MKNCISSRNSAHNRFIAILDHKSHPRSQGHIISNIEPFPVPQGLESSDVEFSCHLRRGNPEMDLSNDFEHCILKGTFRRFTQNTFCGLNSLVDVNTEDNTCFVGICRLSSPLYVKDLAITGGARQSDRPSIFYNCDMSINRFLFRQK